MSKSQKINFGMFYSAIETAESYNAKTGFKRFYPIQSRSGKMTTFGMYDYKSKKHILSKPTDDLNDVFEEIKEMVENPK